MPSWSTNWQQTLMMQLMVVPNQKRFDLLTAWQRSTPTEPWSNNPLGIPARLGPYPRALPTEYASFPSMAEFRNAFERFAESPLGQDVVLALYDEDHPSKLWHAVRALEWPGQTTETDYPSRVLDMTSDSYQKSVGATSPDKRSTSGHVTDVPDVADATRAYSKVATQTANTLRGGSRAIAALIRKASGNG